MNTIPRETPQAGPSALSIATFVLGLLGFFSAGLTAIVAVITGTIEFANMKAGRSARAGYWLNMVGFVLAILAIILFIVLIALGVAANVFLMNNIQGMTEGMQK
jgi:uncharacterized membrane protein